MNEMWMNKQMNKNKQMNVLMVGQINEWLNKNKWINGWVIGWMNEWIDTWSLLPYNAI
jgi:hypothetical protein